MTCGGRHAQDESAVQDATQRHRAPMTEKKDKSVNVKESYECLDTKYAGAADPWCL